VPKSILVGYDPAHYDKAPVHFGIATSRFTGAPLIIGSAYSGSVVVDQMGHGGMEGDLAGEAGVGLDHLRREL